MRIGIDARFLGPEGSGISRYIERLLTYLERIDRKNHYVVWLRSAATWRPANPNWTIMTANERWYTLAEQALLPSRFLQANLDLLHVPHFNIPVLYPRKFVVTIHDLILGEFPTERSSTLEPVLFRAKMTGYRAVLSQAVRRSSRIMTVSDWSRQQLIANFPQAKNKVTVTYESADPLTTPSPTAIFATHGITQPFFLYAGNTYPHKNLERWLQAVKMMHDHGEKFQTVLVGKRDFFSLRLEQFVKKEHIPNVVFYGYASDADLHALYRHARAYVFPSLSEGFGLPGLEAMQAETPVYAARASCLPEVYGDAAKYFDPTSEADMARVLTTALHDDVERQRLITAGAAQVRNYSWERMARETLAVYEGVARQ